MHLFDIIIVNYNSTDYLLKCLETIYKSFNKNNFNIFVQDNNSDDDADRIVNEFPSIHFSKNDRNIGFSAAVNRALKKGTAPYILIINPDSLVFEGFFKSILKYMNENPDVGIMGPKILNSDGSVQGSARSFPTPVTSFFGRTSVLSRWFPNNIITRKSILTTKNGGKSPINVDWISGACMVVRRKAIEDVGLMDERFFMYWEDVDWCKRMWGNGWKVVYYPEASILHYVGGSSKKRYFNSVLEFHKSAYSFFEKNKKTSTSLLIPLITIPLFIRFLFIIFSNVFGLVPPFKNDQRVAKNKKPKSTILILSLVFPPDGVSTSILYGELAEELRSLGHDITVLTTTPHYNEDKEALLRQPLSKQLCGLYYKSNYHGIPVIHAPIPMKGSRVAKRMLDYLRFHIISTIVGIFMVGNFDIILAPSPPLTIGLSAWFLSKMRRNPFIYNVQEIFPDIAVSLGLLKNKRVIRRFEKIERFIYAKSQVVVVISDWFRKRLLSKGVSDDKIVVIPNFTDTEFMKPNDRRNRFSDYHDLEDKFVVLYAGNIGLTQNFENILAAARRLKDLKDLCILIVGDGARRSWLQNQLLKEGCPNIRLLPYQPRSIIPAMYASSNVCLVPLKGGTAQETFPSKIYTIMAAGRPALVAADPDSELSWIIHQSGCGWTVPPDDEKSLSEIIEKLYHQRDEIQKRGMSGRKYVEEFHSKNAIAKQYDRLICRLTQKQQQQTKSFVCPN